MLLTRLLNACYHFPGFVYEHACLLPEVNTIEVEVRPRHGSKPRCSGFRQLAPSYDRLSERALQVHPIMGVRRGVSVLHAPGAVQGLRVKVKEQVPWAMGKHTLTEAYMLFLAHWARKLSVDRDGGGVSRKLGPGVPRGGVRGAVGASAACSGAAAGHRRG